MKIFLKLSKMIIVIMSLMFLPISADEPSAGGGGSTYLSKKDRARLFMLHVHYTLGEVEKSLKLIRIELGDHIGIKGKHLSDKEYETFIKYINGRLADKHHNEFENMLREKLYNILSKLEILSTYALDSRKARLNKIEWEKPKDLNNFQRCMLGIIADVSDSSNTYYLKIDRTYAPPILPKLKLKSEHHLGVHYSGPFKKNRKQIENDPEIIKNPFGISSSTVNKLEPLFFQIKKLHKQYDCEEIVIYSDYNDIANLIRSPNDKIKDFKNYLEKNSIQIKFICIKKPRPEFKKVINCSKNISLYQVTKNHFAYYSIPLRWRSPVEGLKKLK